MVARKYPEEVITELIFNGNPNPTKYEAEHNERALREIMDMLFKPVSEKSRTQGLPDVMTFYQDLIGARFRRTRTQL